MGNPHAPSQGPTPGTVLGEKFRVVRLIGEGGMGLVLEAENLVTGKRVAIKWMRSEVATSGEAVQRFLREARASARVRHPNVVDVYDVVQDGGSVFMVMELLEGEPLTRVLERGGMPAHELITLLLDAMRGVAAAHRQGVIHRDIKPDNIFLAREEDRTALRPKVVDFGISKLNDGEALSLTRTGTTMGTPLYMSFEQLCAARDVDGRTDVYAFGVILYEALTGRPPFEAETFTELIVKITSEKPKSPKLLRPDIPRSLDQVIQKAMAKERDQRYASLEALIADLARYTTAELFRAQMTADAVPVPRVIGSFAPPEPPPPAATPVAMLTEPSEAAPIDTPMHASVSAVPPVPRRRDALPWLGAVAAIGVLLAAVTWFSDPSPAAKPQQAQPQVKPGTVVDAPQPMAAEPLGAIKAPAAQPQSAQPSAAAQPNIPRGKAPPEITPSPAEKAAVVPAQAVKPRTPGDPAHPTAAAHKAGAAPASLVPAAKTNTTPVRREDTSSEKALKLRAGRPRSQDF